MIVRLATVLLATALPLSANAAARPGAPHDEGVPSPIAVSPRGLTAASCPTFSWSPAADASGHELVVYAVSADGQVAAEPLVAAVLPAGALSWTPSAESCLAAGGRFAWSLRGLRAGEPGPWAEAAVFEVAATPSVVEVEAALATLKRYSAAAARRDQAATVSPTQGPRGAQRGTAEQGEATARRAGSAAPRPALPLGGTEPAATRAAKDAPTLGSPSLTTLFRF